jgi:hypothetical protein
MARTAAPRTRTAPAPEPEVTEDEVRDYSTYAEKPITATMTDFADWIVEEVFGGDQKAFDNAEPTRLVSLAGTLRMEFQRSELNKTRRAERQAARVAGNDAEEGEEETAPAPRATRGRAAAAPAAATATPTPPRRRGRPAAATAAAPY